MTGSAEIDALAVEAHHQAQRAVRGRVLRTEVEDHVAGVELHPDLRVGEVPERVRVDVELGQRRVGGAHAVASACLGSAASSSPSPGIGSTSTRPGHGFTTRESSG